MKFKLKDLWKTSYQKGIIFSAVVYLTLIAYLTSVTISAEFISSSLIYIGIAIMVAKLVSIKKIEDYHYFLLGMGVSILYNGMGMLIGWFDITFLSLILPALQQGVITFIVAMMLKVK